MRNWGAQQRCARGPRQGPRAVSGPAAVPVGGGGAWPGFKPTRRATYQRPGATVWRAPEGPEGTGGLRGAAPNEVRSPSLAGGRALRRPEHQRRHKQPGPAGSRVRQRGGYRSTRPLSAHSATTSSRLRPNDRQSWRRRRIHRNMPPTTAAPRPAPPIRPSKPVRARPFFGLVAGTSGAT